MKNQETHRGTISAFNPRKRWGFILDCDGSEWFFHEDNTVKGFAARLDLAVEYEIGPPFSAGKSDQAINIREVSAVKS